MALRERLTSLENELDGIGYRQLPVRALMQHSFQVDAVEVLHHQVRDTRRQRRGIDDAHHVLVADATGRPRLAQKARNRLRILLSGEKELNRDPLLEDAMTRSDYYTGGAKPKLTFDLVFVREALVFADFG